MVNIQFIFKPLENLELADRQHMAGLRGVAARDGLAYIL